MSTIPRRSSLRLDPTTNLKVVEKDSSIIVLTNFLQKNQNNKIENIIENDSIQIVVGANKFDKEDQSKTKIDPILSSAGILINEAISPSYIFNPSRKEDGVVLNQPVQENQEAVNNTEKNISTVTLFGDHIQLVSYLNGVSIYTTPKVLSGLRETPQLSAGAGVSLIHGNYTEGLEPMVKGNKLDAILKQMQLSLSETNYSIFQLGALMTAFLGIFAAHFHIVPQAPVGVLPSLPSIEGAIFSANAIPVQIKSQIDNVISEINAAINKINQSSAFESTYLSDHHKLN